MDNLVALANPWTAAAAAAARTLGAGASVAAVVGHSEWLVHSLEAWD